MKKATLYALKEDRDSILLALQRDGNVMLIPSADEAALPGAENVGNEAEKTNGAIKFITMHAGKSSFLTPRTPVAYNKFLQDTPVAADLAEQVATLEDKIGSLRNEALTMRAQAGALKPWLGLDIPLEKLAATTSTVYFAGYLPELAKDEFLEEIKELTAEAIILEEVPEGRAIVVFAHKSASADVKHFLKAHDFTDVVFPKRVGLAKEIATDLTDAAKMKESLADNLEEEVKKIAHRKEELYLYYDQLVAKQERMALSGVETQKTFFVQGWVRADKTEVVTKAVAEVTSAYDLNFVEPEEGEIPPSVMENGKFSRPYEFVTELYSRPKIGSLDPDFMMAPFHFIFFGMMLSDAGYGLVLTILLYAVLKLFKPRDSAEKLITVILFGGVSTVLWGILFGGWFGLEWRPLLFVPMKEPLKMLALCFGLGALHLVTGMCMKIYLLVKRGQVWAAIFDEVSWLVLFAGLFLMALLPGEIGRDMAIVGAGTIVLTGGREKKNVIAKFFGGLLSLYNISGYVSDLLSYSRLFALGLATGVIAMVINTIAKMLWETGPAGVVIAVFVLVGGHIFNILINVLGSFVHTSRLQYIEFFSKFYEAGGKAFVPLAIRTKYVDVTK
ncbi:MAG: V-type ATP synthase subunit I [Acidaminococcaceae bacterium]|nr:V-type ATP synthase subunit I [Acidaminococcaceae bacterium]